MGKKQACNPFRMTRSEAACVFALSLLLLAGLYVGEVQTWRRDRAPDVVRQRGLPKYSYKINLNSAGWAELSLLPGVGQVTAKRIVEYREKNGPFNSVDDLVRVKGLSRARVARAAKCVTLGPVPAVQKP